jgi:hypothetical protein
MGGKPDVAIRFRDPDTLLNCLTGQTDHVAAVGLGQIVVDGYVPFADALGVATDRIEVYLPR